MPNFNTKKAPLVAGKAPLMYNGYLCSKDDVRSPFVKPPCCEHRFFSTKIARVLIFQKRVHGNGRWQTGAV
jgi:hypothetical protein